MAEPSTFAGATLDRAIHRRRDAGWLAAAQADPASLALLATGGGFVLTGVRRPRPLLVSLPPAVAQAGAEAREPILLGVRADGVPLFALRLDAIDELSGATAAEVAGLRDAAARLSPADAGLLAYAQAILGWQYTHLFCGACGAPTVAEEGGHVRRCTRDGRTYHPRTDPVVIAVVTDGNRLLLGRQASWPPGRYSALAGFVEPGETLEQAAAREIAEEAGVEVAEIAYHSSQPWPFPGSLMVGFLARHAAGEPLARDGELEDVAWFHRDEVAVAATEDGWDRPPHDRPARLLLPPRIAIARRLIEQWLGDA